MTPYVVYSRVAMARSTFLGRGEVPGDAEFCLFALSNILCDTDQARGDFAGATSGTSLTPDPAGNSVLPHDPELFVELSGTARLCELREEESRRGACLLSPITSPPCGLARLLSRKLSKHRNIRFELAV